MTVLLSSASVPPMAESLDASAFGACG